MLAELPAVTPLMEVSETPPLEVPLPLRFTMVATADPSVLFVAVTLLLVTVPL